VHVAIGIEQRAHDVNMPMCRGPMQRIRVVSGLARVGIGAALEQQAYKVQMAALRRRVQASPTAMRCSCIRRANKIGIIGKQSVNSIDVAFGACIKEERVNSTLASLDFSFQGPPTGESVITRDGELG